MDRLQKHWRQSYICWVQVAFEEKEWELGQLEKLKEEQEAEIDEDNEPLFYESMLASLLGTQSSPPSSDTPDLIRLTSKK